MESSGSIKFARSASGEVSIFVAFNDKVKNLISITKTDYRWARVEHYIAAIDKEAELSDQLKSLREELVKLGNDAQIVWPNSNEMWKVLDFTTLTKLIAAAYNIMLSKCELEEMDISVERLDMSIKRSATTSFTRVKEPPKAISIAIDGKLYRLEEGAEIYDIVTENMRAQEVTYKAAMDSLKSSYDGEIARLDNMVRSILAGERTIPDWWSARDLYETSSLITLYPKSNSAAWCLSFIYPRAAIKYVSRGSIIRELKELVPFPPVLVKVLVERDRLYSSSSFLLENVSSDFRSFHLSSGGDCRGDIKFGTLNTYRDVRTWYDQIYKGMIQMCNMGSPYSPSYPAHAELYNKMFTSGTFFWNEELFKPETSGIVEL